MTKIFGECDADGLEREYMPTHWPTISFPDTVERWISLSDAFHSRVNVTNEIAYGDSDRQRLDLFRSEEANGPTLIFIHGGYWRSPKLTKRNYSFCVEPIVEAGALVAMVEYDLCPDVSMDTIVEQVRKSCAWIWRNAETYGGDPNHLHVTGHSAGGHLTAMLATTDWPAYQDGLPEDMIKSIIPVSGLFELEPLRLSSLNADLQLDEGAAERNSPRYLEPTKSMPISVVVGGGESDEFRRQSRDFADTWRGLADTMEYIETSGHDHFAVIESMLEPRNVLTGTILRHLEL